MSKKVEEIAKQRSIDIIGLCDEVMLDKTVQIWIDGFNYKESVNRDSDSIKAETKVLNIRNATILYILKNLREMDISQMGLSKEILENEDVETIFNYFKAKISDILRGI